MLSQATFNRKLAYQYLSFLLNQPVASIQPIYTTPTVPTTTTRGEIEATNLDIQKAKLGSK